MEVVKKVINGVEYEFVNESRGNRSGFVHETRLFKDGRLIGERKVQYYNRTWERYRYQTVMRGLISGLIDSYEEEFKNRWKDKHSVKRLTQAKKEAVLEDLKNNPSKEYIELKELYSIL